ncbi:MAG: hypothetical protein M1327_07205 [Candidatus Thermoplasmatota archaeon]|nr:hypothetical protein [Candidatus Thermoplasmatota archaeon]
MSVLEPGINLKASILQILAAKDCTISGIHNALREQGIEVHRLILTGYLRALKDLEILDEQEVKPSKLYSLSKKTTSDIYSIVGKVASSIDEDKAPEIALGILSTMFNRPIFLREIERCGLISPRRYQKVVPPDRIKYIEKLGAAGVPVPPNSIMIEPDSTFKIPDDIMMRILFEAFNLRRYSRESNKSPQQTL